MVILSKEEQISELKDLIKEYESLVDRIETDPVIDKGDYERQLDDLLERALNAEEELEVFRVD